MASDPSNPMHAAAAAVTAQASAAQTHAHRAMQSVRVLAVVALSLLLAAMLAGSPGLAWASYSDHATEYPATKDLQDSLAGDGIQMASTTVSASQIPDGTYVVPAYTSSYMCILYDPDAAAAAGYNPDNVSASDRSKAKIVVSNGTMTAYFALSAAYTAMYLGTAEEAASLAPADGTPASQYIVADDQSYVLHPYSFSFDSLNVSYDISTYNGASDASARWFNRKLTFVATPGFVAAIQGNEPEPTPEPAPSQDDTTPSADSTTDNANGGSGGGGTNPSGTTNEAPAAGAGAGSGAGSGAGAGSGSGSGSGGVAGTAPGSTSSSATQQGTPSQQATTSDASGVPERDASGSVLRGRQIHIVGRADGGATQASNPLTGGEDLTQHQVSPYLVLGLATAGAAAAGVAACIGGYYHALGRKRPL